MSALLRQSGSGGDQSMEEETDETDDSNYLENDLETFRQNWRSEVKEKNKPQLDENNEDEDDEDENSLESKAQELFQQAVDCESNGDLYDAIRFYKKAFQLVPDIEKKNFNLGRAPSKEKPVENVMEDLEAGFSKSVTIAPSNISAGIGKICEAEVPEETSTHLSALPEELLIWIFKWMVSDELDLSSLGRASAVCKGFYVASRSQALWKSICSRTWGANNIRTPGNGWREYFIRKPRVLPSGCYISKTTYMREGEKGYQDEFYKAWHVVHYYRYIRFFASGMVSMAVTADQPNSVVHSLRQALWPPPVQGMLYGRYRVSKNKVAILLVRKSTENKDKNSRRMKSKRKDSSSYAYLAPDQEMHMEFQIKGKLNRVLEWSRYFIVSKYANGTEKANELDISNASQYPNLKFSEVTSFYTPSSAPV